MTGIKLTLHCLILIHILNRRLENETKVEITLWAIHSSLAFGQACPARTTSKHTTSAFQSAAGKVGSVHLTYTYAVIPDTFLDCKIKPGLVVLLEILENSSENHNKTHTPLKPQWWRLNLSSTWPRITYHTIKYLHWNNWN